MRDNPRLSTQLQIRSAKHILNASNTVTLGQVGPRGAISLLSDYLTNTYVYIVFIRGGSLPTKKNREVFNQPL